MIFVCEYKFVIFCSLVLSYDASFKVYKQASDSIVIPSIFNLFLI